MSQDQIDTPRIPRLPRQTTSRFDRPEPRPEPAAVVRRPVCEGVRGQKPPEYRPRQLCTPRRQRTRRIVLPLGGNGAQRVGDVDVGLCGGRRPFRLIADRREIKRAIDDVLQWRRAGPPRVQVFDGSRETGQCRFRMFTDHRHGARFDLPPLVPCDQASMMEERRNVRTGGQANVFAVSRKRRAAINDGDRPGCTCQLPLRRRAVVRQGDRRAAWIGHRLSGKLPARQGNRLVARRPLNLASAGCMCVVKHTASVDPLENVIRAVDLDRPIRGAASSGVLASVARMKGQHTHR